MTRKTNTDWIQELNVSVAGLAAQVESINGELARISSEQTKLSELLARVQEDGTSHIRDVERMLIDRIADQAREIAVLTDFKKRIESQERVRWLFWIAFAGSLLTLAGNVVILFLNR